MAACRVRLDTVLASLDRLVAIDLASLDRQTGCHPNATLALASLSLAVSGLEVRDAAKAQLTHLATPHCNLTATW